MDFNLIKNTTFDFFKNIFNVYQTAVGFHDLNIKRRKNIITITLVSLTNDTIINMIPKIRILYAIIIQNMINLLRDLTIDYDFRIKDINFTDLKMTIILYIFTSYLNLYTIPVELILQIIKSLDVKDYFNILDVIKIKKYPAEIIKQLKLEYSERVQSYDSSQPFSYNIFTIDDKGNPIKVTKIFLSFKDMDEITHSIDGSFISRKKFTNGELVEMMSIDNIRKNNDKKLDKYDIKL